MNRKKVISLCLSMLVVVTTASSVMAAGHRMSWNGTGILGKRSIQTMKLSKTTKVKVTNNITRAGSVPNKCNAKLTLDTKSGLFGKWKPVYTMKQTTLGKKTWDVTLDAETYSVYFESLKVNGYANPLDMEGYID